MIRVCMTEEKEYCKKCGTEILPFSKKYSISANDYFCIKCAEKLDRAYLAKTTCAICGRRLKPDELKFVLPSSALSDDKMHTMERMCCLVCHKKMAADRIKDVRDTRQMRSALLDAIRKGIVKATIIKQEKSSARESSIEDVK